ncbi:MAG: hypothetical protein AAF585_10615 [Verrucomicrobiota bacterium]
MKAIVHIGTAKTGSTALQRSLGAVRRTLGRRGCLVLLKSELKPYFSGDANYDWARNRYERCIVSSEWLTGLDEVNNRCGAEAVEKLFHGVDADISIVFYFRRPITYLRSWYCDRLSRGEVVDPKAYYDNADWIGFDWYQVASVYSEYFGKENVEARPYELAVDSCVVKDFFQFAKLGEVPRNRVSALQNQGLSDAGIHLLQQIGSQLNAAEVTELRMALQDLPKGPPVSDLNLFGRERFDQVLEHHQSSLAKLFAEFVDEEQFSYADWLNHYDSVDSQNENEFPDVLVEIVRCLIEERKKSKFLRESRLLSSIAKLEWKLKNMWRS